MASMLMLPRKLFLKACSHLALEDLVNLAGVSRDHYIAVQQPLFTKIEIHSFRALVNLGATLMKAPLVSHISQKQRLYWHDLSDAQLRKRHIKSLDLTIDSITEKNGIAGATFAQIMGAIIRKCPGIKINIGLFGIWPNFVSQLSGRVFPGVIVLTIHLGEYDIDEGAACKFRDKVWELVFSGNTFPDLEFVYLNTLATSFQDAPCSMVGAKRLVAEEFDPYDGIGSMELTGSGDFAGLRNMRVVKIECNTHLNARILRSLFGSSTMPQRLERLEIVNCPHLDAASNLDALATLLKSGLQLVKFLRLHLLTYSSVNTDGYRMEYHSEIEAHPEHHLCNIVRELGSNIKGLDLALPFACKQMFLPQGPLQPTRKALAHPDTCIPEAPICTFGSRAIRAGYRFRRIIYYDICNQTHGWEEMAASAENQGDMISWDVLSELSDVGMRYISGCLAMEYAVSEAMKYPAGCFVGGCWHDADGCVAHGRGCLPGM